MVSWYATDIYQDSQSVANKTMLVDLKLDDNISPTAYKYLWYSVEEKSKNMAWIKKRDNLADNLKHRWSNHARC